MHAPDLNTTWAGRFWAARSGSARTALILVPITVVATILRLPGVLPGPPGFRHDEASVALAAQQIERGFFPIYFRDATTTLEPAFIYTVNLTGQLAGWGVSGPRLAAMLLGILAAAACGLWYRQTLGHGWGLAGGLLVASSFSQIVFSRQAVPAIAMAAAGALGLWALSRALARRRHPGSQMPSSWYGLAGVAFGVSIYTGVAMRAAIPVVILIGIFFFLRSGYFALAADRRGLLLGLLVMLLVAAPLISWFWENPGSFQQGMDALQSDRSTGESIASTLSSLVWAGDDDPAHTLSSRPLLDSILLAWGALGLGYALRRPFEPLHAVALIWLTGFLVTIIAIAPGNHSQMLVLSPVLFLFPMRGMQAVVHAARRHGPTARLAAGLVVVVSIAASAAWSIYDYVQWTSNPATYRAFSGDMRDALDEVSALPDDGHPVYFSTGEQGRIVRYLAPDRPRRDFSNTSTLPLSADGAAYLVIPASARVHSSMTIYLGDESLVSAGAGPDAEPSYSMWFVDMRTRDRLPWAVPAIFFEDGPALLGFEVSPVIPVSPTPSVNVVLVYRVAAGGERFRSLARLVAHGGSAPEPTGQTVQPGPDHAVPGDEIILSRVVLAFPDIPDMVADLHTAVQTSDGQYLTPYGPGITLIDDHFVLLNALGYIGPAP